MSNTEKKPEKIYELILTEEQILLVNHCLENYFRMLMGQMGDLSQISWDFASLTYTHDKDDKENLADFLQRRSEVSEILQKAYERAIYPYTVLPGSTDKMMLAQDIWQVIRHELWKNKENKTHYDEISTESREPKFHKWYEREPECRRIEIQEETGEDA